MSELRDYIFVLWADRFDEAAASVFVAEFRKAGLRTRLVGLTGQSAAGEHGLALTTDLTLDEALALATQAACVVIPCNSAALRRLDNDPRLVNLLNQARQGKAVIVAGQAGAKALESFAGWPASQPALVYPDSLGLVGFAQRLAAQFTAPGRARRSALRGSAAFSSPGL